MNYIKKILGAALALVMVMAMMIPVLAVQTGNLKITGTQEGKTYDLYRVFDLTYSDGDGSGNYSYSVNPAFAKYFTDKDISDPVGYIKSLDTEKLSARAQDILGWAIENRVNPVKSVTGADAQTTVEGLEYGYYLLNPLGGSIPKNGNATMFALNTLSDKDTEIVVKAVYPTLDKTFADEAKANEASIGDDIGFKLTSKVPDMTGYNHYYFVVKDTLGKGLTYKEIDSIRVGSKSLTKDDYIVEKKVNADKTTSMRIIFKNFRQYVALLGKDVIINYTATLNEDAAIGEANQNTAFLQYSNNPKFDYDGNKDPVNPDDPDKPKGGGTIPPTGETTPSTTESYTTSLTITKKNGKDELLTGAAFRITGTSVNQVITTGTIYVEDDVAGTVWKLNDGTYTTTDPAGDGVDTSKYASTTVKYRIEHKAVLDTTEAGVNAEAYVDENGKLTFAGLGAGTYEISEIVTPNGYNSINPISVVVTFDPTTKIFTATAGDKDIHVTANVLAMDVINLTGSLLPKTGGTGTLILYVVGGILLAGSVVLLVTKKRMAGEKKIISKESV
ncbi:TPA: isopeptide-forming domain-containing fimbrial protein [Streptococcus suis]